MALTKIKGEGIDGGTISTKTAGTGNLILGSTAGDSIASGGDDNTCIGTNAGTAITTGDRNTLVGATAGDEIVGAERNTAVGYGALHTETEGDRNTAVGVFALSTQNTSGGGNVYNTGVGYGAGNAVTTGDSNTLIGAEAGDALTEGKNNVVVGKGALGSDTKGKECVAIGNGALFQQNLTSLTSVFNVGIGSSAGENISTGYQNTFVGGLAGHYSTTAQQNVAVGYKALYGSGFVTGEGNVAIGDRAMEDPNGACHANTAVGQLAGTNINTGDYNVCVGKSAGSSLTTGGNNIMIGKDAGTSSSPAGNQTTGNGSICLGDDNISDLYCADTSISSSDSRDKTDITDFNIGLNWINDLRPVTYKWDKRSWYGTEEEPYGTPDGSKKKSKVNLGFVAQEVLKTEKANGFADSADTMLTCNITEDGQRYGMKYERLVPILVNAIKELSAKNDALEARIKKLEDG